MRLTGAAQAPADRDGKRQPLCACELNIRLRRRALWKLSDRERDPVSRPERSDEPKSVNTDLGSGAHVEGDPQALVRGLGRTAGGKLRDLEDSSRHPGPVEQQS